MTPGLPTTSRESCRIEVSAGVVSLKEFANWAPLASSGEWCSRKLVRGRLGIVIAHLIHNAKKLMCYETVAGNGCSGTHFYVGVLPGNRFNLREH